MKLAFVETAIFSRRIERLGLDEDLRALQLELLDDPEAGRLDPGTGGLRKVRMSSAGRNKGKRSGARAHYLHLRELSRVYPIFVYSKDEDDTLTSAQKQVLKAVVRAIKGEDRRSPRVRGE